MTLGENGVSKLALNGIRQDNNYFSLLLISEFFPQASLHKLRLNGDSAGD